MDCKSVLENIAAYLDNELDAGLHSQIKQHLDTCPACKKESQLLNQTWNMLDRYPELTPNPQSINKTNAQIKAFGERQPLWLKRWGWERIAGLATAAVLFMSVGLYLLRTNYEQDKPPEGTVVNKSNAEADPLLNYYDELLAGFGDAQEDNGWNPEALKELSPYLFSDEGNF